MTPNTLMLADFVNFIRLREEARLNKEAGKAPPFSKDPVISKYRFCNVDRCQDRVTRWIFVNIIEQHQTSPTLWFNLALARFINWPETIAEYGYFTTWDPEHFCAVLRRRTEAKEKVYTGAYMIRAGTGEDAKLRKEEYLVKRVFNPLWAKRSDRPKSKAECADWDAFLGSIFGMGDFMRNQIITDMKYTHHLPYPWTLDWSDFCLAGPGTRRGLNRLYGRELLTPWKTDEANRRLHDIREMVVTRRPIPDPLAVFSDLNNLSNCFCEWDKYRRVIEGQGEPRSLYRPDNSPLP